MTCQQAPACHLSAPLGPLLQVFVEEADLDELAKTRQESQAEMDKHLADSNAVLDTMRDEVSLSPALFIMIGQGEHSGINVEGIKASTNSVKRCTALSTVASHAVPNVSGGPDDFATDFSSQSEFYLQLEKEGMDPGEGSPEARAEMMNILEELGYDAEATVRGEDGPTWWQQESAARNEAAVSSAAAQAEAAVQQRQEQRDAEAQAEGAAGIWLCCVIPLKTLADEW